MPFDSVDDYLLERSSLYGPDGQPISGKPSPAKQVEIVRSVSFKLNLGDYQSMDFFCSQKAQCEESEASQVSADLYEWCYDQVMESVREVKAKQAAKRQAQSEKRSAA